MLVTMSKAFTREDGADPATPNLRPRAPLPPDAPNYVTPRGLALLERELVALEGERDQLAEAPPSETQKAHLATIAARIIELAGRIHGMVLVPNGAEGGDEVRFGATVTVRDGFDRQRRYQIVGVDEANAAEGLVAFVSPIARALLGRRPGEMATVQTPRGEDELEIVAVAYGHSDRAPRD